MIPTQAMIDKDATRRVGMMFPLSCALGLRFVTGAGVDYPGFDQDAVQKALGNARFAALMNKVTNVFSCGHRTVQLQVTDPVTHQPKTVEAEAHAIYAKDLEAFLAAGG
jgi:hypothetical protein